MTINEQDNRIAFLDYLRVISVFSVLIGHRYWNVLSGAINDPSVHSSLRVFLNEVVAPLASGGGFGVVIFFLISGFIIAEVLSRETTTEFLIRRFFRIYPLYIFAVAVEITVSNAWGAVSIHQLLIKAFLIGDFFNTWYALNGVEWTLRIEVLFYLFAGILRLLPPRGGFDNKKYILTILFLAVLLLNLTAPFPDDLFIGYTSIYAPFTLLGVGFWLFHKKTVSILSFFSFTIFVLLNYFWMISVYQSFWINQHFAVLAVFVFTIFYSMRKILPRSKFIYEVAQLTYPIYLFHNFLIAYIEENVAGWNLPDIEPITRLMAENLGWVLILPKIQFISFVIFIAFCMFTQKFIEEKAIRLGRVLSKKFSVWTQEHAKFMAKI